MEAINWGYEVTSLDLKIPDINYDVTVLFMSQGILM